MRPAGRLRSRQHEPRPSATVNGAQKQRVVRPRLYSPGSKLVQLASRKLPRLNIGGRFRPKHGKQQALKLGHPARVESLHEFRVGYGSRDFGCETLCVCACVCVLRQ